MLFRRMCMLLSLGGMFIDVCYSSLCVTLFESFVSLLIICLVILSIIVSRVLKSPTIYVELSIATLNFISFCFMYFGALLLGEYMFIILTDGLTPFIIIKSLSYMHVKKSMLLCQVNQVH